MTCFVCNKGPCLDTITQKTASACGHSGFTCSRCRSSQIDFCYNCIWVTQPHLRCAVYCDLCVTALQPGNKKIISFKTCHHTSVVCLECATTEHDYCKNCYDYLFGERLYRCLMCNEPYGLPHASPGYKEVVAQCGCRGAGIFCCNLADWDRDRNKDQQHSARNPCRLISSEYKCYACRHPPQYILFKHTDSCKKLLDAVDALNKLSVGP